MTLAPNLNHHRIGFDFNTGQMNAADGCGDIAFIAGGKGMIVDNHQPLIQRPGKTFQNERSEEHTSELQSQ